MRQKADAVATVYARAHEVITSHPLFHYVHLAEIINRINLALTLFLPQKH